MIIKTFLERKLDTLDNMMMMILFSKRVWNYVLDYVSHSYYYSNYSDQDKFKKIESDAQELYDKLDCQTYADGNLKKLKLKHLSGGEKEWQHCYQHYLESTQDCS